MPGLLAGVDPDSVRAVVHSIHSLRQTKINTYAAYSRITLYIYDILLNLDREKELIWPDPVRPSSILYFFVRYPVIANQIFYIFSTTREITEVCNTWDRFTFTVSIIITRIPIIVTFVMRVYAVTDKNVFFIGLLSLLGLLSTVLDVVQVVELSCTQQANPIAFVLTFFSLIVFDIIALVIMIWKLIGVIKVAGGMKKLDSQSVVGLMMKSGTIYFAVITGIQLGGVILYFLPQGLYSTVLNQFTILISSVLISRFLLDMRSIAASESRGPTSGISHSTHLPDLEFAPVDDRTQMGSKAQAKSKGSSTESSVSWRMSWGRRNRDENGASNSTFVQDFNFEGLEYLRGLEMGAKFEDEGINLEERRE